MMRFHGILLGLTFGLLLVPEAAYAQADASNIQRCQRQVVDQTVADENPGLAGSAGSTIDPKIKSALLSASEASHRFDVLSLNGRIQVVTCLVSDRDFTDAKTIMDGIAETPGAPAKIFWFQAVIDYQAGDQVDALTAAERSFVLNPDDKDNAAFLNARFPMQFARDRGLLIEKSQEEGPDYVYWTTLSGDERTVIKQNGGTTYSNKGAQPCHVSSNYSSSVGRIEIWYYNCITPGGIGTSSYTFVNGKLTDSASY